MKDKLWTITLGIAYLLVLYTAISGVRYRFAHPEKTQTQCMLEINDVWRWK